MSVLGTFKEKFLASTNLGKNLPIAGGFITDKGNVEDSIKYDYETMVKLGDDERIYSLLALCASMAYTSFRGVVMREKDIFKEEEMGDIEKSVVNECIRLCKKINIQEMFYTYAWNIVQFGDYIEKMVYDSKGVTEMISLPINRMTCVEKKSDVHQTNRFITEKKIYVLNETVKARRNALESIIGRDNNGIPDDTHKEYDVDDIIHVSFNARGQYYRDLMGRDTYGVWSKSPIYTLSVLINWKKQSITTDIKWKRRSVPREHWMLDVNTITPDGFEGTKEQKIKKATDATNQIIESFRHIVDSPQPDQSVITTNSVESKILEADTANYKEPNDIIRQINSFVGTPIGAPEAFLGGKIENFAGTTMSALFSEMRIDVICKIIARGLEKMLRKHVKVVIPEVDEEVLDRIEIKVDSTLNQVALEKTKVALMMVNMGLYSKNEIRSVTGHNGVVTEPFVKEVGGDVLGSSEDRQVADASRTTGDEPVNNTSPGSNQNDLLGRGVRSAKVKGGVKNEGSS